MKNAEDIRTEAIALLVELLRDIGAKADLECKNHREAEKSPGALADFRTFSYHREAAALNYALAYRCEQLIEEITGALLFDELDAQDEAAEQAAHDADSAMEAFVKAADAERYAQRDEYVNSADDVNPVSGRNYAEEAWQRAEAEREGAEELAAERAESSAAPVEHVDYTEAADVLQIEHDMAVEAADEHDPETCPECADQYRAEQDADAEAMANPDSYTAAQANGEACTVCGWGFGEGAVTVPTGVVLDGGQLFAHASCVESEVV